MKSPLKIIGQVRVAALLCGYHMEQIRLCERSPGSCQISVSSEYVETVGYYTASALTLGQKTGNSPFSGPG